MPTHPPKKKATKATLKKAMNASDLLDPGANEHDKQLAQKALPVLQAMQDYTASPLYLQRLQGMGVKDSEGVQQDRLATLGRVKFGHMTGGNSNTPRNWGWGASGEEKGKGGFIAMNKDKPLSTIAHEISHNTNRSADLPLAQGATKFTATGSSLAPVESWQMVNNARMAPEIKQKAFQLYKDSAKGPFGSLKTDPTAAVGGYDEHGKDVAELKSDLDGLRYLLYQKGVTKKFGETLDAEKLKRAMNLPDVQKDEIFQRMLKQYDPEAIIYLNNKIAKGKATESNLA